MLPRGLWTENWGDPDGRYTLGLLLNVVVHPANIQDRDGAFHCAAPGATTISVIERIFADGGYAGRKMAMTVWRTGAPSASSASKKSLLPRSAIPIRRASSFALEAAGLPIR
jgi:hypothetical protein